MPKNLAQDNLIDNTNVEDSTSPPEFELIPHTSKAEKSDLEILKKLLSRLPGRIRNPLGRVADLPGIVVSVIKDLPKYFIIQLKNTVANIKENYLKIKKIIAYFKNPKVLLMHLQIGLKIRYKKLKSFVQDIPTHIKNIPYYVTAFITNIPRLPYHLKNYTLALKNSKETRHKTAKILVTALLVLLGYKLYVDFKQAEAAWFDDKWTFRKKLTLTNNGAATTDKKIKFDIDTATLISEGKMQAGGGDIRITAQNGELLPYYYDGDGGIIATRADYVQRDGSGPKTIDTTTGAPGTGRRLVQTSTGTIYAFIRDSGACEVWMSPDGNTWTEQDTSNNPNCQTDSSRSASIAIDGSDTLHLTYSASIDTLDYITFDTATNTFGSPELILQNTDGNDLSLIYANSISVDSNNIPHAVMASYATDIDLTYYVPIKYVNKIGGTWGSVVDLDDIGVVTFHKSPSIVINEDNIPEISYINDNDSDLTAAVGDDNDPDTAGQWTLYDVDATVNGTGGERGASIAVDQAGNTWIAYLDDDGGTDNINLVKHTDGSAWTTWETPIETSNEGFEPSLAIITSDILVFYEDDNGNIVYNEYDSGDETWSGETTLETGGNLSDVHPRWSYYYNNDGYLIDYVYADGSDSYWNYLDPRPVNVDDPDDIDKPISSRQIVRTSTGTLYTYLNDSGNCEIWKSSDGTTWSLEASETNCSDGYPVAIAIDSSNYIHAVSHNSSTGDFWYRKFNTSTDAWDASGETIRTCATSGGDEIAIAVDASLIPHVVYYCNDSGTDVIEYNNRIGGSWETSANAPDLESKIPSQVSIDLRGGTPEISYINTTDGQLTVAFGSDNDPIGDTTPFSLIDVDTSVNNTSQERGSSLAFDQEENSWVAYTNSSDTTDKLISLAKHNNSDGSGTWTSDITNSNVGYEPSISVIGQEIYLFYQDDNNDVVYDIYHSGEDTPSWEGETVLYSGTYQDVKAKWQNFNNYFGPNRVDLLFSDGTDVYWSFLNLRRMPNKIDDPNNRTIPYTEGRQTVRTSTGILYSLINDNTETNIWKSTDEGNAWYKPDTSTIPSCDNLDAASIAIDSHDTIHFVCSASTVVKYYTFPTTTENWSSSSNVFTAATELYDTAIAIDSNDEPHVLISDYDNTFSATYATKYTNKISTGSWKTPVTVISNPNAGGNNDWFDILINEDNIPEVVNGTQTSENMWAHLGNQNNATTFTSKIVYPAAKIVDGEQQLSMAVDTSGNTWISFTDTADYITLAKKPDEESWTADWDIHYSNNVGYESSIVAEGSDIYVFYQDDNDDIVYAVFDGSSSWDAEIVLEQGSALKDIKTRWSYINNYDSTGTARVQTNTYYFDASDGGPNDPNSVWSSDGSAFDNDTTVSASTSTSGSTSSNFLHGEGTTSPTSGGTITSVKARIYGNAGASTTISGTIYTDGTDETLGTPINDKNTSSWDVYTTLSAPAGGWTWQKINDLEVKIHIDTSTSSEAHKVEILVESTNDSAQVEVDYLYSDGTDVFYNRLALYNETRTCTNACLWILDDEIPTGDSNYYMYYGNPTASNGSRSTNFAETELVSYSYVEGNEEIGPGPTMILKFDEGYGSTAQDSTLYNNDATLDAGVGDKPSIEKQINIIDQEYGTAGGGDPGDNSLGLIYWDEDAYSGESVYFEAIIRCDSCTGGNTEVDVVLANDVGSTVPSSIVSTTSSSYTRVRTSSPITLTDNEEYTVEVTRDATGGTAYVKAARLVIVQSGASLTATETQVEIGANASGTSDALEALSVPKIYRYDHDAYNDGTIDSYFEATIKSSTAPGANLDTGTTYPTTFSTYADTTNGYDDNDWDTASNVGADDTNYASITHSSFDSPDYSYVLRARNFPFSTTIPNDATIKGVEVTIERHYENTTVSDALVQLVNHSAGDETDRIGNNKSTGAAFPTTDGTGIFGGSTDAWGASLTPSIVNSANFGVDYVMQATGGSRADGFVDYIRMIVYYQEADVTGTASAVLYNITNSQTVDTVSTTSTSWDRQRGSALSTNWDTTNDDEYEVRLYTSGTDQTVYLANAKIVTQQTKTSTITTTEAIHQYNPLETSASSDTYASQEFDNNFNADSFDASLGTFTAYFEPTIKTSNGSNAYYARLDYGGGIGEVTGTSTSYTADTSSNIWSSLPSSGTSDIDIQIRNASAGTTTSVSGSTLKIQATSMSDEPDPNPAWQSEDMCVAGRCLYFDGSDDTAAVTTSDYIDLSDHLAGEFTYSFWVKPNSDGESDLGQIFSKGANTYAQVLNEGSDGLADLKVSVDLATTDGSDVFTNALTLNQWQHVSLVYVDDADDETKVYINGKLVGSTSGGSGAPATDTNNLVIGGSTYNFHGFIDEFVIYPSEKSASEINAIYNSGKAGIGSTSEGTTAVLGSQNQDYLSKGLAGHWKLDESSGNASDSSGNSRTLTNNGTATFVNGKFGNGSEHVPASTQYFDYSSTIDNVKTVAFWTNPDNNTNYFVQLTDSAYITSSSGTLSAAGFTNPTIYVNGKVSSSIEADSWQHVVVTTETEIDASLFRLGRTTTNYYDGSFDEPRLYNRALTSSEVEKLYNWAPGPVGQWKLDEGTGTSTVYDTSGNQNNGTMTGFAESDWVFGKYGKSLYFDGSEDKVTVSDADDLDFGTAGLTVEAWIIHDGTADTNNEYIVTKADGTNGGYKLYMDDSGDICFVTDDDSQWDTDDSACTSGVNYDDGDWHHLAGIKDGTSKLQLYVDGVLVATDSSIADTNTLSNSGSLNIGVDIDGTTDYFDGKIDEVKLFNYAKTPQQVISSMNAGHPTPGSPIGSAYGHWKFDESYGSTAYDSGFGENNGSLGSGDSAPSWTLSGKYHSGLDFDGSNDYVDMGDIMDLSSSDDLTLTGWFNRDTFTTDDTIIAKRNGTSASDTGYIVYLDDANDTLIFEISDGTDEYQLESTTSFDSTGWQYFAVVWDDDSASNSEVYVNGAADNATATGTISSIDAVNAGSLRVGTETDNGNPFDGKLDEIKIYNSTLTSSQIKADYNKGVATAFGDVSGHSEECCNIPDPTAHWKIDEGTGTSTITDYAGGGKNLTMNNLEEADWTKEHFLNRNDFYSLNFDGSEEYLSIADDDELDLPSGDVFAYSLWFKHAAMTDGSADYLAAKATTGAGFKIYMDGSGDICFAADDDATWTPDVTVCTTSSDFDDDSWHHLAIINRSDASFDRFHIFIDGKYEGGTQQNISDPGNSEVMYFGVDGDGSNGFWEGYIDDIRYYNGNTLNPLQINYLYNEGEPIAWYKMDECEGTTVYNSATLPSGANAGMHGTITIGGSGDLTSAGTCSSGTSTEAWNSGTTGKRNASLGFDGNDDYVDVGDEDRLDFTIYDDFTFEAWVSRETYNSTDVIFAKDDDISSGGPSYAFLVNPAEKFGFYITGSSGSGFCLSDDGIIDNSAWYHLVGVFTYDSDLSTSVETQDMRIYANGRLVKICSDQSPTGFGDSAHSFRIGSESDGDNPFDGLIDSVRIFSGALNANQVKKLYNGGAVRFGPETGSP